MTRFTIEHEQRGLFCYMRLAGHPPQFCLACETAWQASPERAEAATARTRFVERRKRERESLR